MAFPTSLPSYTITAGADTPNNTAGGLGLSGLLNSFEVDVTAIGTKVGTGASTPAAGKVLRANGTGTSIWGAVDLTTDVTGALPIAKGGTGGATAAAAAANLAVEVGKLLFPVGSYYMNETNSTNPATLLGFGTWTAVADKFIVGKGSGTFATAGNTGGEENHVLTTSEMPSHTHGAVGGTVGGGANGNQVVVGATGAAALTFIQNTGGDGGHNNLPPYIVAYIWKRTA